MLPAAFDMDRALADVHWLVDDIGPRVSGQPAELETIVGLRARLESAGWALALAEPADNVVACRGSGRTLLLAHHDSVERSPGAGDNAAGVAILLELARSSAAEDLCLGFPRAEERGLVGSREMADTLRSWHPAPESLELVVALDLLGWADQGAGGPVELAANGLGAQWDHASLSWLRDRAEAAHIELSQPYAYRTVSRAAPWMERSDHGPFSSLGFRAVHLLHRGPHGVFPSYHQPTDRPVDPVAVAQAASLLEAIATDSPPPGAEGDPGAAGDASAVIFGVLFPGWAIWGLWGAGVLSGAADLRQLRALPSQLWRSILGVLGAMGIMALSLTLAPFAPGVEERTAEAVVGIPATGWWAAAPWVLALGAGTFLGLRQLLGARGSAPLSAALLALLALKVDVLVAMPLAAGALLGRIHPVLCLLGPLYLLRPDGLRELAFQGLLGPSLWGLLWLLALPCFGRYEGGSPPRRRVNGSAVTPPESPT